MELDRTIEMLAFNLKMLGKTSRKRILVSAGKPSDKQRMLPALQKLAGMGIEIYATEGTSALLEDNGVLNRRIYKVSERREPNIGSFLAQDRLDLVINVLVGNHNYDEASDSNLIRSLAIENGIPLITSVEVAMETIDNLEARQARQVTHRVQPEDVQPWDLHREFLKRVEALGGYASHHAHFDKAYLISVDNLRLGQVDMQKKWHLYDYLKENYTLEDLVDRMSRAVDMMISQGVTYCRTLVDADNIVKLLPINAALAVKSLYAGRIHLEIGVQPLRGVLEPESRKYFTDACPMADYIGGLPSRDRPTPERHLDYLFQLARELNKPIDVHVDQENNPDESETELLALKTMEYGLGGRVNAIHAISLAAKPERERQRIIEVVKDAGLGIVVCPSAALSMKQLTKTAPLHNSIAPVPELLEAGVAVYLGVDNINDLFMPFTDGDMWFEARMLMEACRFYDIDAVARLACRRPACGLAPAKGTVATGGAAVPSSTKPDAAPVSLSQGVM